tara:strand:- start:48 stop:425 length:378 start_codon:yes stop_codon:yes gene_type:complete
MKTVSKSFRLDTKTVDWLKSVSDTQSITQTDLLKDALDNYIREKGSSSANVQISKAIEYSEGGALDTDTTLQDLGIASVGGAIGYFLSGYIREEMGKDEDKGLQILMGLGSGLLALLLTSALRKP